MFLVEQLGQSFIYMALYDLFIHHDGFRQFFSCWLIDLSGQDAEHLAHSSSQSQCMIWFILPAHTSHKINYCIGLSRVARKPNARL